MREGGLDAPLRNPLDWTSSEFYDEKALDDEMRRVFDLCHTCRRCFNLCDSFPRLFDLIDHSPSGELDTVDSKGFKPVVDACTLCDMCFMVSCPYVPPHEFNIDFAQLMLRARAVSYRKGEVGSVRKFLAHTDLHGKIGTKLSSLANWSTSSQNKITRRILEWVAGIHREAHLPRYTNQTLLQQGQKNIPLNEEAPAFGKKVVLYATCYGNYNDPEIGLALRTVLALNGIASKIVYPKCCGMPLLEQGNLVEVAKNAEEIADALLPFVDEGYEIIGLVPSCVLMMKHEWPLLLPKSEKIQKLASATFDVAEYIVILNNQFGLVEGMSSLEGGVSIHMPCHARAQNIGQKAVEMLRFIPNTDIHVVERCSGHGGSWGVMKENFPIALKNGQPVVKQIKKKSPKYVVSECPLAGDHIIQGLENEGVNYAHAPHPIELIALSYGLLKKDAFANA